MPGQRHSQPTRTSVDDVQMTLNRAQPYSGGELSVSRVESANLTKRHNHFARKIRKVAAMSASQVKAEQQSERLVNSEQNIYQNT